MDRTLRELVIDARPRGTHGPLAAERVQGRTVLDHLLDLALAQNASRGTIAIYAERDEHEELFHTLSQRPDGRFLLTDGAPPGDASILRTDRLYDPSRLRKVVRGGGDLESAAIWRLDGPQAVAAAGDELTRRQSYQPIGRYWALAPARALARWLVPTRVRPNALTIAAAILMLVAAALIAGTHGNVLCGLAAAMAMALALVLDTADGHLARLQGTASAFGRWLDAWLDELCDMALHAAIAWSAFAASGKPAWLVVGMVYAMGKYVFIIGANEVEPEAKSEASAVSRPGPSGVQRIVRLAGHADVRWHLWIVLAAAGRLEIALGAYAVYFPMRSLLGAVRKGVGVRHA